MTDEKVVTLAAAPEEPPDPDIIDLCRELLGYAKQGKIVGLAVQYVRREDDGGRCGAHSIVGDVARHEIVTHIEQHAFNIRHHIYDDTFHREREEFDDEELGEEPPEPEPAG